MPGQEDLAWEKRYIGVIRVFYEDRHFGFIRSDDIHAAFGSDAFLSDKELGEFAVGSTVSFCIAEKNGKPQARLLEAAEEKNNIAVWVGEDGFKKAIDLDKEAANAVKNKRYNGIVSCFYPERNFGFIKCDEVTAECGMDAFLNGETGITAPNTHVSFILKKDKKDRPQARYVEVLDTPFIDPSTRRDASALALPEPSTRPRSAVGFSDAKKSRSRSRRSRSGSGRNKRRRRSGWGNDAPPDDDRPPMPRSEQPPQPTSSTDDPDCPIGKTVELQGLKHEDMNGVRGVVRGYNPEIGRYSVDLEGNAGEFKLKPENLKDISKELRQQAALKEAQAAAAAVEAELQAAALRPVVPYTPQLQTAAYTPAPVVDYTPLASSRPAPVATPADIRAVIGKTVEVQGLSARPEMNGMRGVVKEFDSELLRFAVEIEGGRGEFKLKPENLRDISSEVAMQQLSEATPALKGTYSMGGNGVIFKVCPITVRDRVSLVSDGGMALTMIQQECSVLCEITIPDDGLELPVLTLAGTVETIEAASAKIRTHLMIEQAELPEASSLGLSGKKDPFASSLEDKLERLWKKSGADVAELGPDGVPEWERERWKSIGWTEPKTKKDYKKEKEDAWNKKEAERKEKEATWNPVKKLQSDADVPDWEKDRWKSVGWTEPKSRGGSSGKESWNASKSQDKHSDSSWGSKKASRGRDDDIAG